MAAIKKALITLLGGRGNIPKEEELDEVAKHLFKTVRDAVDDDAGGDFVTRKDLYAYLVMNSESGISKKTVDRLFSKVDVNGDGLLSEAEFIPVIHRCYALLKAQLAWGDSGSALRVPQVYVVPGSSAHNAKSGTRAFGVEVVRRKSMRWLWQIYRELDQDNDGFISIAEFKKYIKRKQEHVAHMSASIFTSLDRNRDGLITFQELLQNLFPAASRNDIKLLMRMARPENYEVSQKVDTELLADVRNIFQIFDDDHSGSLDRDEFMHALGLLGFSPEEADDIFKEIDRDGSGEVSIQEFEQWYDSGQTLQAKRLQEADRDSDADEV